MEVTWTDLKSSATVLEREIDELLAKVNTFLPSGGLSNLNSTQISNQGQAFAKACADLDTRLSRLMQVNDQMASFLSNYERGGVFDQSMRSQFSGCRETFRSYCSEFNRAQSTISSELKRAELLAGNNASQEPSALNNRARSSDYLLRENDRINSCDHLLDEQISIAIGVKENLNHQRSAMSAINKQLMQLSKKYPAIGTVMKKIQFKKRKDSIILAGVIVTCLIFMFLFVMR